MILEYGNVILRAIELKDKDLLLEMINNPSIERMTGGWNLPVSEHAQEKWMIGYQDTQTTIRWIIEGKNNKTAFGMIVLSDIDWKDRCGFIHYKINPNEMKREKGDMKNALYAVIQYAFDELGLHRIEGSIIDYNVFSKKLIKAMGFQKEGILRSKVFKGGDWHDQEFYGLIENEFNRYEDGSAPWQHNERDEIVVEKTKEQ